MPNTIDGQYILYVLLIFSFLSDIFTEKTPIFVGEQGFKRVGLPVWIKRESGENPEQSRCCKFRKSSDISEPLVLRESGRRRNGASQKTCPFIKGRIARGLALRYEKILIPNKEFRKEPENASDHV